MPETEIKLAVPDAASARSILRKAGFRLVHRRVFEANVVYDSPGHQLRRKSQLIRIREAGKSAVLTYKGAPVPGRHKSREELEIRVSDAGTLSEILQRVGYQPIFRYEKFRAEYQQAKKHGVATVDETPIGAFIELEGDASWIDRTARKLGFPEKDYITASYARLYLDWCKAHRIKPANMVF
jgi:adenylate cyclase class 2